MAAVVRNLGDYEERCEEDFPASDYGVSELAYLSTTYGYDCVCGVDCYRPKCYWILGCFGNEGHSVLDAWIRFNNIVPCKQD